MALYTRAHSSETRRPLTGPPYSSASTKESDTKGRLRVDNWIVQGLYYDAVKKTVELRLLTVFQHVAYPTRVSGVADKNSAVTPRDLRPTVADQSFKPPLSVLQNFRSVVDDPAAP